MAEHLRARGPDLTGIGGRFLIVEARYYDGVGEMLMSGAQAAFAAAFFGPEESGMINAVLDALARQERPGDFNKT